MLSAPYLYTNLIVYHVKMLRLVIVASTLLCAGAEFPLGANITKGEKFQVQPETYEITLKANSKLVSYAPVANGDRLRLSEENAAVFTLYAVNNGYVFVNNAVNDMLCLTDWSGFRLLNYPRTNDMPQDCIVYMEQMNVDSHANVLEYFIDSNDRVCVKQSNLDPNSWFRFYVVKREKRWYVKITEVELTSTDQKAQASIFSIQHAPCRAFVTEKLKDNFICRILRTAKNCDESQKFVTAHENWRLALLNRIHASTTTEVYTSTTNHQVTKEMENQDIKELRNLANNIDDYIDEISNDLYSNNHFWCDYVDVLCSYTNKGVSLKNTLFVFFIFYYTLIHLNQ